MKKVSIAVSDLQAVLTALEEGKISIKDILTLINKENDQVKKDSEEMITLTVDYSRTLKQMIADGKYDWKNENITEKNFPIPEEVKGKKVEISTKLFHFNRDISSEDAKKEMDKDGFRPATLFEQQAFAQKHPELQRQFPIVALGSVWRSTYGIRRVPYLRVDDDERGLRLDWLGFIWRADCRFLAVRK